MALAPLPAPRPGQFSETSAAGHALYSPQAVALATFLGAPMGGTVILALNYRRLGQSRAATLSVVCGILGTAVLIALGFLLPTHTPGLVIGLVPVLIMRQTARSLQGDTFEMHKLAGGKVASMWKAAGIGLLNLVIVLGVIFGVVMITEVGKGTRMEFGKSDIVYSGSATAADAKALGKALTDFGYFGETKAASVFLTKDSTGTTLKFVVSEESGKKPTTLRAVGGIVDIVAPSVGGEPITLKLLSPTLDELQTTVVNNPVSDRKDFLGSAPATNP